ncbi:MAG TPA: CDC27 family protein [Gammaproteobacteria bacterium]
MKTLAMRLLLIACVIVIWMAGEPASAAEAPRRTERVPAMRESVYRQLGTAREQAGNEAYADALVTLDGLRERGNLNSYEVAMLWNLYAFVHYSTQDYERAIGAYENVLAQQAIPESLENATLYSLAQMHVVTEKYADALAVLNDWLARVEEPNANAIMLLGQVHYQLGNYAEARAAIERAVRDARSRNETVRENWYLLLRAILYAEKDYERLAAVLEDLVRVYPKREYWVQLSAVYGELGDAKRQLATLETAYDLGVLEKESELVMLAQLLLANGIPYKAGEVLAQGLESGVIETGPDTLRLLADAWVLAKEYERSVAALKRAAGTQASGELDLRLAQVLLEMERYGDALQAARDAIEKGGFDQIDDAHLIAGLALYNLERLDAAADAFAQAAAFEDTGKMAQQWLDFIGKERARRAALVQGGS